MAPDAVVPGPRAPLRVDPGGPFQVPPVVSESWRSLPGGSRVRTMLGLLELAVRAKMARGLSRAEAMRELRRECRLR